MAAIRQSDDMVVLAGIKSTGRHGAVPKDEYCRPINSRGRGVA
jgi:hypothetical protein